MVLQLKLPLPELALLTGGAPPSPRHRIFCNRSLRLDDIDWVGFDMDYTLAVYHQHEMDRLSIEATIDKLIARGYPEALRTMEYRTDFPIRGLLVDRKLGNVLKIDRYKYAKVAYHGMRALTRDERRAAYHRRRLNPASERFHWVDTLYALPEVTVYAAAIELLEREVGELSYEQLFNDVRECIDASHQDGSILNHILDEPSRYVWRDPALGAALHQLRSAGKKLFLLTNSHPGYTDSMMRYLLEGHRNGGSGPSHPQYSLWRKYFDVVITAARKPRFFTHRDPFERVFATGDRRPVDSLELDQMYFGGHLAKLQALLATTPDRVLYIGDHIYGDVLRAKKQTAWRTMMIIQEMNDELDAHQDVEHSLQRLDLLDEQRGRLIDDLRDLKQAHKELIRANGSSVAAEAERTRHRRAIDRLKARIRATEAEYETLEQGVSHRFHPYWGSLFKAGPETSSFGHQVETYAGLYTSRVSNLLHYSPAHYFQSPRDRMPHELR